MDQKAIKWNFRSLNGPVSLKIDLKGPEFTQKSQIEPKDLTMDQKVSKWIKRSPNSHNSLRPC